MAAIGESENNNMTKFEAGAMPRSDEPARRQVIARLAGSAAAACLGLPVFAQSAHPKSLRIGTTFDSSGIESANATGLFLGSTAYFNALIGPITATALLATIGDCTNFDSGRQFAAWLGLVPRQHSSGGKPRMLGISKRGDCYVRKLLVHGARAVIRTRQSKPQVDDWLARLLGRRHVNVAAVALANKTARTAWAMLRRAEDYRRPATT